MEVHQPELADKRGVRAIANEVLADWKKHSKYEGLGSNLMKWFREVLHRMDPCSSSAQLSTYCEGKACVHLQRLPCEGLGDGRARHADVLPIVPQCAFAAVLLKHICR